MTKENRHIVLFDGVCNLCNSSVSYILDKNKDNHFYFASLQSDFGQEILKKNNLKTDDFDTFLYFNPDNQTLYDRSSAAIRVIGQLNPFYYKLIKVFLILPKFIRDSVYNFVSKNRYRWFGEKETCALTPPELKHRFID